MTSHGNGQTIIVLGSSHSFSKHHTSKRAQDQLARENCCCTKAAQTFDEGFDELMLTTESHRGHQTYIIVRSTHLPGVHDEQGVDPDIFGAAGQ
jgi:hypothetical protein